MTAKVEPDIELLVKEKVEDELKSLSSRRKKEVTKTAQYVLEIMISEMTRVITVAVSAAVTAAMDQMIETLRGKTVDDFQMQRQTYVAPICMPPKTYEELLDILPDSNPESSTSTSSAPTTSTNTPPTRISRETGEAEIIKIIHEYLNGRNASVYGWGIINDNGDPAQQLRGVEVTILPNSECEYFYGDVVRDTMLCSFVHCTAPEFNCVKHRQKQKKSTSSIGTKKQEHPDVRHSTSQETPLPLYIGMILHAETLKRGLVDKLFSLALSISYDRVLRLSAEMVNRACQMFQTEQVVCPPTLRGSVFMTAAVDNIDTTLFPQQQKIRSMEQGSLSCNTQCVQMEEWNVGLSSLAGLLYPGLLTIYLNITMRYHPLLPLSTAQQYRPPP
ncbi:hypothetical protein Pcinc_025838 [Petrolisthes cinctipes]|uniref:Peptidase S1 domain-containing protein n=1 Tax=Petrolisthes cinctipes TaxID=88211 RepID=A0AAE1F767_PETCI|nr:hypothetical protein Pcinc_025838 [Petrolisthes cinctipes]